jgi:hypothetical protein
LVKFVFNMAEARRQLSDYPKGLAFLQGYSERELFDFCENFNLPYIGLVDINDVRRLARSYIVKERKLIQNGLFNFITSDNEENERREEL